MTYLPCRCYMWGTARCDECTNRYKRASGGETKMWHTSTKGLMEKGKELITQECVVTDTEELWAIIESLENIDDMRGEE